jgi:branched-chain amino acid transport system ATP-binding protein
VTTTAVGLRGVTAGREGGAIVNELSLDVPAGEVVALLGANGGGKTTTVRVICGLERMERGSIEVLGKDVTRATARARAKIGLATVADDRGLFGQLTVSENLRVACLRGAPGLALDDWFPSVVPLLRRRCGLLSGGEQTMVALARAMVRRPGALVVDELSTGLSPALTADAFALLRRAATEWGTGVLLAEQSARLALRHADRALVLRHGRVVFEGVAADLLREPDLLASTYLGETDG